MEGTPNSHGLGYRPNTREERAKIPYVGRLLGAPPVRLPARISFDDLIEIRDQSLSGSCVGQSYANSIRTRLRLLGHATPLLSALSIYTPTCMEALARPLQPGEKVPDDGCMPSQAIRSVQTTGVATEDAWPYDDAMVGEQVPLDVFEDANNFLPFTIDGEYAIDLTGDALVAAIQHALSERYPVPFGTEVDQAFMDHVGTAPIGARRGQSLGGHMLFFCGYEVTQRGVVFRIANSWGTSWGDHGFANVDESFVKDPNFGDASAFTMAAKT